MPNQQIVFPANFATASAMAFTNPDGSAQLVGTDTPLPVNGPLTDSQLRASPVPVTLTGGGSSGGLTDTQLRASPVPVALASGGGLTDTQLRATPVPVSGGLTDSQLRAAAVPVAGPLTDTQLRASAVPVTGALTDTQLRASAVPTTVADGALVSLGAVADAAASADSGSFSLIALTKRLLGKLATGQKPMAQSLAVTLASDQTGLEPGASAITGTTMPTGGSGLTGWLSAIYKACLAATPAGTNHIGGVSVDDVADSLVTTGSVTSATTVVSAATAGFGGGSFHVTSAGTTCTVTYEQSNDNATWVALPVVALSSSNNIPQTTSTLTGFFGFSATAAYVRARVSAYTSGTVTIALAQKRAVPSLVGTSLGGGNATIGTVNVTGTVNVNVGYTDSTTALAASATFTGTGRNTTATQYAFYVASAYADQAGTLFIDQSLDSGTTYLPAASQAVAAATPVQLALRLSGALGSTNLYRVRFVNGATAQGTFRLTSGFTAA